MEKSVKRLQLQKFGIFGFALFIIFLVMMFFRNTSSETVSGRHYKKEIRTGVDGLSEKELWIEKSENALDDIKKDNKKLEVQNAQLQKQLDTLQSIVVKLGYGFRNQEDGSSSNNDTHNVETSKSLVDKMDDFISQNGVIGNQNDAHHLIKEIANTRMLKSGIKVFKFNNADTELDENFIFAGTYARGILLGSVTVNAGISSSSNPKPVLLRLTDMGNLPNKIKGFLKDAVVIGAAYGNLSSESVVIRLERIIKIDKKTGVGIDLAIKGYVAGENGDSDIRGIVFDRAGAVARTAAVSGFLSGAAEYMTSNNNSAVKFEPNSGLAEFSPQKGSKMIEQGASKGIGNAVEKYADFIIKRAEQMQPVIKIDGGRKLTIVFTESVKATSVNMKKVRYQLMQKKDRAL